jgi:hypothetical protein
VRARLAALEPGSQGGDKMGRRDMISIVRVPKVRFGVSQAEDGRRVLTPFGPFGRCYAYSDTLKHRFAVSTATISWMTALAALAVLAEYTSGRFRAARSFALLVSSLIVADAIRVITLLLLFRGGERLRMGNGIPFGQTFFGTPFALQTGTFISIYVEAVFILGFILGVPTLFEKMYQWIGTTIFFHLGIYVMRFIRSRYYY